MNDPQAVAMRRVFCIAISARSLFRTRRLPTLSRMWASARTLPDDRLRFGRQNRRPGEPVAAPASYAPGFAAAVSLTSAFALPLFESSALRALSQSDRNWTMPDVVSG